MENLQYSTVRLLDHKTSATSGFVKNSEQIKEIIKEWQIETTTSFVSWQTEKHFGEAGKLRHNILFI